MLQADRGQRFVGDPRVRGSVDLAIHFEQADNPTLGADRQIRAANVAIKLR